MKLLEHFPCQSEKQPDAAAYIEFVLGLVIQGVPSGRGLGFADMDLGSSTILPGQ